MMVMATVTVWAAAQKRREREELHGLKQANEASNMKEYGAIVERARALKVRFAMMCVTYKDLVSEQQGQQPPRVLRKDFHNTVGGRTASACRTANAAVAAELRKEMDGRLHKHLLDGEKAPPDQLKAISLKVESEGDPNNSRPHFE